MSDKFISAIQLPPPSKPINIPKIPNIPNANRNKMNGIHNPFAPMFTKAQTINNNQ